MSGVILRCPNCGTTARSTGECAACHESAVRYQCTNHSPGRWLESPACPACGARFGQERSAPAALPAADSRGRDDGAAARASPPAGPPSPAAGGCLVRLVIMLVLLFLLMAAAPLLFGLSLLQMLRS